MITISMLVGGDWNMVGLFSIIYWDKMFPIDELIFFKMVETTNQMRRHPRNVDKT